MVQQTAQKTSSTTNNKQQTTAKTYRPNLAGFFWAAFPLAIPEAWAARLSSFCVGGAVSGAASVGGGGAAGEAATAVG